jgi:hypothetical protein
MAAAIVPIITTLLPEIISLITGLVHKHAPVAEATSGPGTGPVKFADVFVAVMKDLTNAKVAGQISAIPDDTTVKFIIQTVVTSMKLDGLLNPPQAAPVAVPDGAQSIVLSSGQSLMIRVA